MATTDPLATAVETFAAPIEGLIIALGQGLAQAQQGLDQNSIQTQEAIDTNPMMSQYGLQATWYQFPRVDLELKLSITVAQDQSSSTSNRSPSRAPIFAAQFRPIKIIAQPVSASYQTHFNYDAQAASTLTLSVVPVPSPRAGAQGVQPLMNEEQVRAAAFASRVVRA